MSGTNRSEAAAALSTSMVCVDGQDLWVSVDSSTKDRPPLLLFNGIGANV